MKINNKYIGFLLLSILLVLIGIFCVVFLYSSNDKQGLDIVNHGWSRYESKDWNLKIEYPQSWFEQTKKGGELTPFGIIFSDDRDFIEDGKLAPNQTSPRKWINLTLYKTNQSIDEYFSSEVNSKKITNISKDETVVSGLRLLKSKGAIGQDTYLAAYIKKGEYIYILESIIKNKTDVLEVESIFNSMASSLVI